MFTQCVVLATLIVATLSDFTIHQDGHQHECTNLICVKGAFDKVEHALTKDNSKEQKCTLCSQCANFGYSVCAQPLSKALRFKREVDEDHCTCSNVVPDTCKPSQISSTTKKDANSRVFRICYLSTLRTPPPVLGLNHKEDFIVTIGQFWLDDYWKDFELSNLTLFYKFEVKSPEHCDEIGKVTTINDSSTPLHICTSSLPIEMNGENIPDVNGKKSHDPTDSDDQYDDDAPPEVEFGRDVFVGAKYVDLWYTVTVKRPRQMSFGEKPFRDVTTVVSSETLKYNLEPENKFSGIDDASANDDADDDNAPASKTGHNAVSKVNIEPDVDEDDESDEEDDKTDPIPTDNPGITDDDMEDKLKSEANVDPEEGDDGETEEVVEEDSKEETTTMDPDEEIDEDDDKTEEGNVDDNKEETGEGDSEETETQTEDSQEEESVATTTEDPSEDSAETDSTIVTLDDDANAGNETSSFIAEYLAQWPMMRVVFVLVGIASVILVAAACCYRYRGCCCYSDQQKVVTKTSNGYEYHVTGQSGQEMVGPPETQKLTQ